MASEDFIRSSLEAIQQSILQLRNEMISYREVQDAKVETVRILTETTTKDLHKRIAEMEQRRDEKFDHIEGVLAEQRGARKMFLWVLSIMGAILGFLIEHARITWTGK